MANGDTANYTLRYNEITQALEGSFGLNWEALVLSNTVPPTDITSALLTGFVQVSGVVTASDTILTAFEKLSFATQGGISGEVPYSSGGTLAYDPNFIWNGTTHRLGIGDQPNFDLDIQKTTGASGTVSGSVTIFLPLPAMPYGKRLIISIIPFCLVSVEQRIRDFLIRISL